MLYNIFMAIYEKQQRLEWHLKWAVKAFGLWLLCFIFSLVFLDTWAIVGVSIIFLPLFGLLLSLTMQLNQIDEEKRKDAK